MKRFSCPVCRKEVHFDNSVCLSCEAALAFDSDAIRFAALSRDTQSPRPCANRDVAGCNWLARDGTKFCPACMHNRTIPDTSDPGKVANWRAIEQAKRYLFYSLLRWGLPHPLRSDEVPDGLAFDFLADSATPDAPSVLTGHADGLVTLNIAEGDDAEREARRTAMGEPYRTLIGHMRHEVGHYYWQVLVRDAGRLDAFRDLFGDDRQDYGEALKRHYAQGPRSDWRDSFISSYASAHPWEDFAETWAHYIHIVDSSETAHAFGMSLRDRTGGDVEMDTDPYRRGTLAETLADWVPLTVAMNAINRSMGQPDLYPFVLSDAVERKLGFIHDLIHAGR
jgi:hypothetical protein